MKNYFFSILTLLFLTNCKKEISLDQTNSETISQNLSIQENRELVTIKTTHSPVIIPKKNLPFKNVMLLNASLIGYFEELGALEVIKGVSSPEYVYSVALKKKLQNHSVLDIGLNQKYNVELILAEKPEAIFTNYVASYENIYQLLQKNGIKIIFLDEYKEKNPLEKAAYIMLIGRLIGKNKEAEVKYAEIEKNYIHLKKIAEKASTKPIVIANTMYGNQWFMPSGDSYVAQLLADANADYPWRNNHGEAALTLSFEEVLSKSQQAKYWVNLGSFLNKKQLKASNIHYQKIPCFEQGKLYSYNNRSLDSSNDYFESGVVRVDKILKDYILIFHPELLKGETLYYMNELK